jgi:multicomponent Na+:H+ antiporter subunit E
MRIFAANLVLALMWCGLKGSFAPGVLALGFLFGFVLLAFVVPMPGSVKYRNRMLRGVAFGGYYVRELVVSSVRVAADVLRPRFRMQPGVVGVPLDARTDVEITALTNLVSLTPGTLGLEVSPDRRTLFVHAMYLEDGDADRFRRSLKQELEQRVLRVVRG